MFSWNQDSSLEEVLFFFPVCTSTPGFLVASAVPTWAKIYNRPLPGRSYTIKTDARGIPRRGGGEGCAKNWWRFCRIFAPGPVGHELDRIDDSCSRCKPARSGLATTWLVSQYNLN